MNLLAHQAALGDWALTLPLLRALPSPTMHLAPASRAKLAQRLVPGVTGIAIEHHDWTLLHAPHGHRDVSSPTRQMLDRLDGWVVSFLSDGRDDWADNLQRLAPCAAVAFVEARPPAHWRGHVHDWHLDQLRAQGLSLTCSPLPLRLHPRGRIVLHLGSGGVGKMWLPDRFADLAGRLASEHAVQLIAGEAEADRYAGVLPRDCRVLGTLDELASVLEAARLVVGNDSGPSHLAAQMGVPVLAIFGPTDPDRWRPMGPSVEVLAPAQPCSMDWLSVEQAAQACRQVLAALSARLG